MTFAEKLQALRKHRELSQEDLAEQLNTSRTTVSRWETGHSMPDLAYVLQLSDFFKVSVDYLLKDSVADDSAVGHNIGAFAGTATDFQYLRILFWICTGINGAGMVIAMLGWRQVHNPVPLVLGLVMNLLACVFLEVFPPKGMDKLMMRYARRRFYAANVWMLLPTPIYIIVELIYTVEHYSNVIPYLVAGAIYILIAACLSLYLIRQYRK